MKTGIIFTRSRPSVCYCYNVDVGIVLACAACGTVFTIPVSPISIGENMSKFRLPHFANPVCNGKSILVMVWAFGELVVPSDIVDVLSIALIMLETPRAAGCCAACPSQAAAEDLSRGDRWLCRLGAAQRNPTTGTLC